MMWLNYGILTDAVLIYYSFSRCGTKKWLEKFFGFVRKYY